MAMHLRCDSTFVQDKGWYAAAQQYEDFLRRHNSAYMLFLELGVGYNTPSIIKYPFWRMVYQNSSAVYACVNYGQAFAPEEIRRKSICLDADIGELIPHLITASPFPGSHS